MARARSPSSLEAGRCFLNCSFNKMENETKMRMAELILKPGTSNEELDLIQRSTQKKKED